MQDYDDPKVEAQWCAERRQEIAGYLRNEGVAHGRIGDEPAWHVAPYVSVWAIESASTPEALGWWAISGDLPNDYVSATNAKDPRQAVRSIANFWLEAAQYILRGDNHPTFRIGSGTQSKDLAPILMSRAKLLLKWADDETLWEGDED